jgi:HemY protein
MKLILLTILAIALGIGIYRVGGGDPGYVHLFYGGYSIELSVATFVVIFLGVALTLYLVVRFLGGVLRAPASARSWNFRRRQDKSQDNLGKGMLCLVAGNWRRAEKLLLSGSANSRIPAVHYLAAAQAAQEAGNTANRDRYLALARESVPGEQLSVALTQARLYQQAGQLEQALAVLEQAGGVGAGNPQVTAMLVQAYDALHEWEQLRAVLPRARMQKALPEEVLKRIEQRSYVDALVAAGDTEIEREWNALPRAYRKNPRSVTMYARHLVRIGDPDQAEKLVREALQSGWDEQLVGLYGVIEASKPHKMFRVAERWALAHPQSASLHLCMARLAVMRGEEEEATSYLETCIKLGGGAEAFAELGKLSERSNDVAQALEYYRLGLQHVQEPVPQPSLPRSAAMPTAPPEDNSDATL